MRHCVYQDKDTQRQDAGDDHCDGIDSAGHVIYCHHDVHIVMREAPVLAPLNILLVTAHPVLEDRPGVAWLHTQPLVIKLPVLLPFVKVVPVPFEEVGFAHRLPAQCRVDALPGQAAPQLHQASHSVKVAITDVRFGARKSWPITQRRTGRSWLSLVFSFRSGVNSANRKSCTRAKSTHGTDPAATSTGEAERSHDSTGIVGVFQTQGVPQLMDCDQEEIVPCGRNTQPGCIHP
ncbi:hypothetical protein IHE44_0004425 [Lamprotornis superbus]|uniref:Uncharacterized protein n=1 Tax=Lamprotornis superbus TaxID=245042 RepID=A0A835NGT3_9PASS|nr:hypothetical protein IHE44_0004425 [Lamprotornis superbus]